MCYLVIETFFSPYSASICTDPEGDNIVFSDFNEAQRFVNTECQEGIIVPFQIQRHE